MILPNNTAGYSDTAINSVEDSAAPGSITSMSDETATIDADAQNDNQGISERGMRERSEESPQGETLGDSSSMIGQ